MLARLAHAETTPERVYYTGDMANCSGWFIVHPANDGNVQLIEDAGGEDRTFFVRPNHIGNVYHGHCNPRFVTEAAYREFYRIRRAQQ